MRAPVVHEGECAFLANTSTHTHLAGALPPGRPASPAVTCGKYLHTYVLLLLALRRCTLFICARTLATCVYDCTLTTERTDFRPQKAINVLLTVTVLELSDNLWLNDTMSPTDCVKLPKRCSVAVACCCRLCFCERILCSSSSSLSLLDLSGLPLLDASSRALDLSPVCAPGFAPPAAPPAAPAGLSPGTAGAPRAPGVRASSATGAAAAASAAPATSPAHVAISTPEASSAAACIVGIRDGLGCCATAMACWSRLALKGDSPKPAKAMLFGAGCINNHTTRVRRTCLERLKHCAHLEHDVHIDILDARAAKLGTQARSRFASVWRPVDARSGRGSVGCESSYYDMYSLLLRDDMSALGRGVRELAASSARQDEGAALASVKGSSGARADAKCGAAARRAFGGSKHRLVIRGAWGWHDGFLLHDGAHAKTAPRPCLALVAGPVLAARMLPALWLATDCGAVASISCH